jgi:hypothetical protein
MKAVSLVTAVLLFALFLYVSFVAIVFHFIPHFLAWELDMNLVLFLMLDALILQLISWVYKKLPAKPKNAVFSWMEKISIF